MAATNTKSGEFTPLNTRRKKSIAAILALSCDLAAWLWYPFFWDEDGYAAIGALMLAVLFAGIGGVVAALGTLVSTVRARHKHLRPRSGLGIVALVVSVVSVAIFIATFNWIVSPAG